MIPIKADFGAHLQATIETAESLLKLSIVEHECCCDLKDIDFSGGHSPDYEKRAIQNLYILRYYGAYLCEYRWIYRKILDYLEGRIVNALSVGCGCGVDLAGLYFAAQDNNFDIGKIAYIGCDINDWQDKIEFDSLINRLIIVLT
jgi:hypothetical protein